MEAGHIHPNPIFEGMEKRLEIDFSMGLGTPSRGLRVLDRDMLDELTTLAACCIVSSRSNAHMDAYVLSESSLFVWRDKWVLKTCGTTRLLRAVPRLLQVAAALGLVPRRVKYSRATFLFPALQPFPYTSFQSEVAFLQQHFPLLASSAEVLGSPFEGLQWHVFVADSQQARPQAHRPTVNLEVCMTHLAAPQAAQFFRSGAFVSAQETTRSSGIAALKPGALIDDYVFDPCGYSMNAILGTGLLTIHITPEAHQSFASVEFSGFAEDIPEPGALLAQLTRIFAPGHMTVALTSDCGAPHAWPVAAAPVGYAPQGAVSHYAIPQGGAVLYYTLTGGAGGDEQGMQVFGAVAASAAADLEKGLFGSALSVACGAGGAKTALLHHASSFLTHGAGGSSVMLCGSDGSDGDVDSRSEGSLPEDPESPMA